MGCFFSCSGEGLDGSAACGDGPRDTGDFEVRDTVFGATQPADVGRGRSRLRTELGCCCAIDRAGETSQTGKEAAASVGLLKRERPTKKSKERTFLGRKQTGRGVAGTQTLKINNPKKSFEKNNKSEEVSFPPFYFCKMRARF